MDKNYTIAIYLRISSEDSEVNRESNSITNQRIFLQEFINSKDDLKNCSIIEAIDDGFTGTSFDRPAIKSVLEGIRNKQINCVVVKDISRFGRNYIEVGKYLQQLFPFMRVRFISVNDDYDSADPKKSNNFITSFKAIVAEYYSQDLSFKIKSSLENKAKNGQYINAFSPYGYVKSSSNKHLLEIDIESVDIVKWIFHEFVNGKSKSQIARDLNSQGVLTPSRYKAKNGVKLHSTACQQDNFWMDERIHKILTDERYIGTTVYGKTQLTTMGSKHYIKNKKDKWIVAPNMHSNIVSEEIFYKAQSKIKEVNPPSAKSRNMFHSLIVCGICSHSLYRSQRSSKPYFYCNTRRFTQKFSCKDTKIYLSDIRESILYSIKLQAELAIKAEELLNLKSLAKRTKLKALKNEYIRSEKAIVRWNKRAKKLFEQKTEGIITEEECNIEREICLKNQIDEEMKLQELNQKINELKEQIEYDRSIIDIYKPYNFIDDIDDDAITSLVEKIYIFDSNTMEIQWKYQNQLDSLSCIVGSAMEKQ